MAMEALRIAAKESKFMKFILGGFIFLAVGGLVFTDVGGYFTDGVGRDEVLRVEGVSLSMREFDREIQPVLQQMGFSPEDAYKTGLINAYIEGRINEILSLRASENLKLLADDTVIAGEIRKLFGDVPKERVRAILQAQGINEQALARNIKTEFISDYLSKLPLGITAYQPSYMVKGESRLSAERRSGTIWTLPISDIVNDIEITDADIEAYYEQNQDRFLIPETRQFTVGEMSTRMIESDLSEITEEAVREEYDSRQSEFTLPEQRKIIQASVRNPDDAQEVYERALDGESLREAIEAVTLSLAGYRDEAVYEEESFPPNLAEKAFDEKVQAGDVTPPIKTLIGYTVMKVTDITPERALDFDEVNGNIRADLELSQLYDTLYNKMIDTESLIDSGQSFNAIADETKLETQTLDDFATRGDIVSFNNILGEAVRLSPSLIDELYGLPQGGVTYPVELNDNRYVVIEVSEIKPETVPPLDDVRDEITQLIKRERQLETARNMLQNVDGTLLSQAQETNFTDIARGDDHPHIEMIYHESLNDEAYQTVIKENDIIISKIETVTFADGEDYNGQDDYLELQAAIIDSLMGQYYRRNADISINHELLKESYGGV